MTPRYAESCTPDRRDGMLVQDSLCLSESIYDAGKAFNPDNARQFFHGSGTPFLFYPRGNLPGQYQVLNASPALNVDRRADFLRWRYGR